MEHQQRDPNLRQSIWLSLSQPIIYHAFNQNDWMSGTLYMASCNTMGITLHSLL